jgi:hypothetical protein
VTIAKLFLSTDRVHSVAPADERDLALSKIPFRLNLTVVFRSYCGFSALEHYLHWWLNHNRFGLIQVLVTGGFQ